MSKEGQANNHTNLCFVLFTLYIVLHAYYILLSHTFGLIELYATADGNKYKGGIYMVFEYMDHDLTGLADRPGMRFSVPQIKVFCVI